MVAVLLVTHGDLAKALLNSLSLIIGEVPLIECHGLYHGDNVEEFKEKVGKSITRLNDASEGDGVFVVTDLFGGSPSNVVARCFYDLGKSIKSECVTGVNLPMLLELVTQKEGKSLTELKQMCLEVGPTSIVDLKERVKVD